MEISKIEGRFDDIEGDVVDIEDKVDDIEGETENIQECINGLDKAIGTIAEAILVQQKSGEIPPGLMRELEKYSKWGKRK